MKYLYSTMLITTLVVLQLVYVVSLKHATAVTREGVRSAGYLESTGNISARRSADNKLDDAPRIQVTEKPYGLRYSIDQNTWTLYATVLQLKMTSVYGRPGEIAQIEYSLDGERKRHAWIVVRIDNYSFDNDANTIIEAGQQLRLYVSGTYVSPTGVDWKKCPKDDIYCMNASFIEGGFPSSVDYDGLTLCPSNTLIRSGYAPDDWIDGMLAWKIRAILDL